MTAAADMSIPYATPPVARRSRAPVLAGAAIIVGGWGMILLAGCFLIGVLLVNVDMNARKMSLGIYYVTTSEVVLMTTLYLLAFASFAGGAVMLFIGTRALLRILLT